MDTELAKWIIGGMAAAVVGLAGFIVKLYSDLKDARAEVKKCQEERLAQAEEHYRQLLVLNNMVKSKKGGQP